MLSIQTTPVFQEEKEYAFYMLFSELLGIAYRIEYQEIQGHAIAIDGVRVMNFEDGFPCNMVLQEVLELDQWPADKPLDGLPDLFAASFFMLTRCEEQNGAELDQHGRFPAQKAQAWLLGFLDRPVVNEWADWLWAQLCRCGLKAERKRRAFNLSVSCDVDHPRLWWNNTDRLKTLAGALLKRGDLQELRYWWKNFIFQQKDPYDVFDEWFALLEEQGLKAQFNFMGERKQSSDCWYPLHHSFVQNLMHKLAENGHAIGFHPSYESFDTEELFNKELDSLRKISPLLITSGRQHYLRFRAPETWRIWESAGLNEDCTLGYPESEGFRCGICHDFPVFDTRQRKMLQLREKPLIAMDITLAQYQKYTPQQALDRLLALRARVEKHGGDFTLLWHNSSWNGIYWEDWKYVFQQIIRRSF